MERRLCSTPETLYAHRRRDRGDNKKVSISYPGLVEDVDTGSTILIDDGLIGLKVQHRKEKELVCEVVNGGELGEKKGCQRT